MAKNLKLRYLPLFREDMLSVVDYITNTLSNPTAAQRLVQQVESAILKRLPVADTFAPYSSLKDREVDYYYIQVKNYLVFYVIVDEGTDIYMEVRRFVYKGRNIASLIV